MIFSTARVPMVQADPSVSSDFGFTAHQSQYLAYWLTLEGAAEQTISRTIAGAKVHMNPHQVEAALFALRSPLSRGVLLADEVGLGKTIEASLVIAQRWAERRRRVVLVVPATLRMQWSQELAEKFSLPSVILESRSFNQALKNGALNPFERNDEIVICSYEFAARKQTELRRVTWDLVIFDEAHRLRNVYKSSGNKTATVLRTVVRDRLKLLLTATPLQNSLMELYGLVSVIDPHFFGDDIAFRSRYIAGGEQQLHDLRRRLQPICRRTLRREVQEEGGINFTNRYSLTQDFRPTPEEAALYRGVSEYLRRDDLLAIKSGARHLVTLVLRKILASSSFAIAGTLETLIHRLEQHRGVTVDALDDFDTVDDLSDELDSDLDSEPEGDTDLNRELEELKSYRKLAERISHNAKGNALLTVLKRAFDMTQRLGGPRKAVIFTESRRTQEYLKSLLEENGYTGELVLLNGTNTDPQSRAIYEHWRQRHPDRVSGAKTADTKAAIVEAFRTWGTILISTEAGGEGVNLQFCALVINYDLPWNPQRVEQRIGRVHRYGQQHDVVVVNFLNKGNRADELVFKLLAEKFRLFEGVFGASDEILGAIESGVDIERRINEIYQRCRSEDEIEQAFAELQADLADRLDPRAREVRRTLLEHFDIQVVRRLRSRRKGIERDLDDYRNALLCLARAELPDARVFDRGFEYQGQRYVLDWHREREEDVVFFRPNRGLGRELIQRAQERSVTPVALGFCYRQLKAQYSDLKFWIGHAGYLEVSLLCIDSAQPEEHLVLSAYIDNGDELAPDLCRRLLRVPARVLTEAVLPDTRRLDTIRQSQVAELIARTEANNERFYEEETDKLDRWAEDRRLAMELDIKRLDQQIKEQKKQLRSLPGLKEKTRARRVIKTLERERDEQMMKFYENRKEIEEQEEEVLDSVEARLAIHTKIKHLFTIRWRLDP